MRSPVGRALRYKSTSQICEHEPNKTTWKSIRRYIIERNQLNGADTKTDGQILP